MKIKQYFRVIRQLLASYLSTALAYRSSFIQSAVASILWSVFSFISAILVTSQTPSVLGMTRGDLLLLASNYGIIVGLHHWLCSRGFGTFSETIHKGELDGYLLRPFDTLTFLSLRNVAWPSFPRIIGSIFVTTAVIHLYGFTTSILNIGAFLLLTVFSFITIYSIYSIACTLLIWHSYLSNIIEFIQASVGTSRYSLHMVRYLPLWLIIFYIPFLMIVNVPTRALIGHLTWIDAVGLISLSLTLFTFSRWFWRFALHRYTGASG